MDASVVVAVALAVMNLPVYLLIRRLYFANWDEVADAVRFWFTPDLWSAFHGEFFDDWWAELKLGFFIATCVGLVSLEFALIAPVIQRL